MAGKYKCTVYQVSKTGKTKTWLGSSTYKSMVHIRNYLTKLVCNQLYPTFMAGTTLYAVVRDLTFSPTYNQKVCSIKLVTGNVPVYQTGYKFVRGTGLVRTTK